MDQLPHRGFPLRCMLFAVKVFGHDHFGRQLRPGLRNFDILLLENYFPTIIRNFRHAAVPFELVERLDLGIAEDSPDFELPALAGNPVLNAVLQNRGGGATRLPPSRQSNFISSINHLADLSYWF